VRGLCRRLPAASAVILELEGLSASEGALATLESLPGITAAVRDRTGIRIETTDFGVPLAAALEHIANLGLCVTSIRTAQVTLEDVFISLTGHALRDGPAAAVLT